MTKSAQKRGFTLVELLVVVSIIAILSVIGIVIFTNTQKSAREAKKKADINTIFKAYEGSFDPIKGEYRVLVGSDFTSGAVPIPETGNNYFIQGPNKDPNQKSNFVVCAVLQEGATCPGDQTACFCLQSTRGTPVDLASLSGSFVTTIPGLKLWLKADAITPVLNDGDPVTTWNDQSGNNNNAQAISQPIYKASIANGKPALQFYAKYMNTPAFVIKQVYMVFKSPNAVFNNYGGPLGVINYGNGDQRPFIFENGQTYFHSNPWPLAVWQNGVAITAAPFNMAPITNWMILTVNTAYPTNSRAYQIGGSESSYLASLEIAEIIGYDNVLSDADRKKVEGYLGSKYSISVQP